MEPVGATRTLNVWATSPKALTARRDDEMTKPQDGCVAAAKGPILPPESTYAGPNEPQSRKEGMRMTARVGRTAPDFEATAFAEGGFKNVKLSDYKEKWVVLCFYPGDFTFV
jgi:hypothetical protein